MAQQITITRNSTLRYAANTIIHKLLNIYVINKTLLEKTLASLLNIDIKTNKTNSSQLEVKHNNNKNKIRNKLKIIKNRLKLESKRKTLSPSTEDTEPRTSKRPQSNFLNKTQTDFTKTTLQYKRKKPTKKQTKELIESGLISETDNFSSEQLLKLVRQL